MRFDQIVANLCFVLCVLLGVSFYAQTTDNPALLPQRDGSHDFDFLIGDWKAHVRRCRIA